ncbi:hypothetical protein VCHA53O466_40106 [Vibrio chagasii]|nr:hypothetical protein VCHA53O466_40106 [Vibrio chagasii]
MTEFEKILANRSAEVTKKLSVDKQEHIHKLFSKIHEKANDGAKAKMRKQLLINAVRIAKVGGIVGAAAVLGSGAMDVGAASLDALINSSASGQEALDAAQSCKALMASGITKFVSGGAIALSVVGLHKKATLSRDDVHSPSAFNELIMKAMDSSGVTSLIKSGAEASSEPMIKATNDFISDLASLSPDALESTLSIVDAHDVKAKNSNTMRFK